MPRKNEYGKYIFAAGEVSSFVICPEAWRLNYMEQIQARPELTRQILRGIESLHTGC